MLRRKMQLWRLLQRYGLYKEDEKQMKHRYRLYLNGDYYGFGPIDYINSLIRDYLVDCELYGREKVDFRVEKIVKKHG